MLNKIRRMLPHLVILICNMYLVFFFIDRVNAAMNFIDNNLTKGLLTALCLAGLVNAWAMMKQSSRKSAARRSGPAPSGAGSGRRGPTGQSNRQSASVRTRPRSGAGEAKYGANTRSRSSRDGARPWDDELTSGRFGQDVGLGRRRADADMDDDARYGDRPSDSGFGKNVGLKRRRY